LIRLEFGIGQLDPERHSKTVPSGLRPASNPRRDEDRVCRVVTARAASRNVCRERRRMADSKC
jgi:hypothetical protein